MIASAIADRLRAAQVVTALDGIDHLTEAPRVPAALAHTFFARPGDPRAGGPGFERSAGLPALNVCAAIDAVGDRDDERVGDRQQGRARDEEQAAVEQRQAQAHGAPRQVQPRARRVSRRPSPHVPQIR